jgi:hypothetical protein
MKIPDKIIDQIQISWDGEPEYIFTKAENIPPEYGMLADFLKITNWSFIRFIAEGIATRSSRDMNYSGFLYPEDLDTDEEKFEGVKIYDYYDELILSESAFISLMSRLLDLLVREAQSRQLTVITEDWWDQFVTFSEQIKQIKI